MNNNSQYNVIDLGIEVYNINYDYLDFTEKITRNIILENS
jgi:hypothetical protein